MRRITRVAVDGVDPPLAWFECYACMSRSNALGCLIKGALPNTTEGEPLGKIEHTKASNSLYLSQYRTLRPVPITPNGDVADTMRTQHVSQILNQHASSRIAGFTHMKHATIEDVQCALLTQLIRRITTGEEAALSLFYHHTLSRVYALALRISGCCDLAEEICVETFWQVWRDATSYDSSRGQPLAWVLVITRSRALDALRRRGRIEYCPDPEIYLDGVSCPEGSPLDQLMQAEQSGALSRALTTLTPVQRQMVGLAFYKDLSHQEISDQTGLPLGTVKSHLKRAQDTLRIAICQA